MCLFRERRGARESLWGSSRGDGSGGDRIEWGSIHRGPNGRHSGQRGGEGRGPVDRTPRETEARGVSTDGGARGGQRRLQGTGSLTTPGWAEIPRRVRERGGGGSEGCAWSGGTRVGRGVQCRPARARREGEGRRRAETRLGTGPLGASRRSPQPPRATPTIGLVSTSEPQRCHRIHATGACF